MFPGFHGCALYPSDSVQVALSLVYREHIPGGEVTVLAAGIVAGCGHEMSVMVGEGVGGLTSSLLWFLASPRARPC